MYHISSSGSTIPAKANGGHADSADSADYATTAGYANTAGAIGSLEG